MSVSIWLRARALPASSIAENRKAFKAYVHPDEKLEANKNAHLFTENMNRIQILPVPAFAAQFFIGFVSNLVMIVIQNLILDP